MRHLLRVAAVALLAALPGCERDVPAPATAPPEPVAEDSPEATPTPSVEPEAAGEPAPDLPCERERLAWKLDEAAGSWQPFCFASPVRRDTSLWTSDGRRVASLAPARCDARPTLATLTVATAESVSTHETGVEAFHFGHGAGLAWLGDLLVAGGGERCVSGVARMEVHALDAEGKLVTRFDHHSAAGGESRVWPVLLSPREPERDAPRLVAVRDLETRGGNLDVRRAPGVDLQDRHVAHRPCYQVYPKPPSREELGCGEGRFTWSKLQFQEPRVAADSALFSGTPLSWAWDPEREQLAILGALDPTLEVWPIEDLEHEMRWTLRRDGWVLGADGSARPLPAAPVLGDGATLLRDVARERYLLIDPFGTASYVLDEGMRGEARWAPLAHAPLPATPTELRGERRLSDAAGAPAPLARFTHWRWPYFAYFDTTLGAAVVIPYDAGEGPCLPLEGEAGLHGCPTSHP